jgi:hypothetical protein
LEGRDFAKSREISKSCKESIDGPLWQALWKQASINEGVPVVEGRNRNYKDDFLFLQPITISGKVIGRYLGEVVGKIPDMREDRFNQLKNSQDFFEPGRLMRETHVVIVDPSALKITVSPNRPLAADATGTLVEVPAHERAEIVPREIMVPFSFKNLKMLAIYPLAGMENGPVFDLTSSSSSSRVFNQCNTLQDQNRILIMRKEVVGRNMPFDGEQGQQTLVTSCGQRVVTVRERAFYDAINILKTGTCSDNQAPWSFARSAEVVLINGFNFRAAIGGFAPGAGVHVYSLLHDIPVPNVGVGLGASAEVQDIGT